MINQLRAKITANQFEFSRHALDQSILRGITVQELREAIGGGEVIEEYPDDKCGASCLVIGMTKSGRPIHIQCSHPSRKTLKIITLYQPDPEQWIDYKVRRK
jgi:glutamine phosphoribosylpyrophosphate amidotransferase